MRCSSLEQPPSSSGCVPAAADLAFRRKRVFNLEIVSSVLFVSMATFDDVSTLQEHTKGSHDVVLQL